MSVICILEEANSSLRISFKTNKNRITFLFKWQNGLCSVLKSVLALLQVVDNIFSMANKKITRKEI